MHLKQLEAFGFKSFADKVVFDFEKNLTVFVGPNGCGKSNVVDAVKWVLGDQSAKSLRGSEMLDVIFNGSAHRKPLNFCEVTLTFNNSSGTLRLDSPEVSVTRRLYRSGESEYLINKALCRLMDIRQLFYDTGAGTQSYSIIEQGRIGVLLEANAKERRLLFEEAAGIHQYKESKKKALRRLERVEQNLQRIGDVLNELERNLRSVTRQASKARRAKAISDKLRQIKLDILLYETYTGKTSLREVESAMMAAQDRATELATDLSKAQETTVTQQEKMSELDEELSEVQSRLSSLRENLAGLEESIRAERRAIEEMKTEAERARQASKEAGTRAASVAQEREKVELDLATAQKTLANREDSVQTISEVLQREQSAYHDTAQTLEASRRDAVDMLGQRTQRQQLLTQAEAEVGKIDYRIRSARAEVDRANDQLRFAHAEGEAVQRRLAQTRHRRDTLETEQSGIRNLQLRTEDEIDRLSTKTQDLRNEIERCRSRRTVLEDLNESGEGLSPGVRAVLNDLRNDWSARGDLLGLVADCLGVDPSLETAIEAALGLGIEALVVGSAETADDLLRKLGERGLGRATFLALERIRSNGDSLPSLEADAAAPGCLGRAADRVVCDDEVRPVCNALLGDVLLFETAQQARDAHRFAAPGSRWRRVSLSGEVYEPNGAVSGGKYRIDRLGLIGRRNEITRLDGVEDDLRLKTQAIEEQIGFLEKRAQKLARDDERIAHDLAALADTGMELKGIMSAIEREESRSVEEKQVAADEIRELESERSTHADHIQKLRDELESIKAQERRQAERVEELTRKLNEEEEAVSRRRTSLEEIKRDVSTFTAKVETLTQHEQSLSEQFSGWRDEADREARRAEALDDRRTSNESQLADKEQVREETASQIEDLDATVRRLAEEKDTARLQFEDSRGHERALNNQLQQAREQAADIEKQQIELKLGLEGKVEQARSEFQLDINEELTERGSVPEVSEEMREEAEKLENRLHRLGPVNMYALEEQKQLEERLTWHKAQAEDLQSARSSVKDVISRINRKSRKQFQETFDAVRENFSQIFRKLFGGGKADLILQEGEDILEAGIEIRARPPGKEPRSIMQLSGGEKAMTTIALLFAVFRSRPAPFCILDEVDAPLDEANVDRFNMIVQEFMDRSQFVVITHNKRTMQYADVLYGITMPEPGVSKRIAVKYAEIEEHLPMEEIDRQAAEARENAQKDVAKKAPVEEERPAEAPQAVPVEAETADALGGGDD